MQKLLSLPPNLAQNFYSIESKPSPEWFATHDPIDQKLGSGGGTAYLLEQAWRQTGQNLSFDDWLNNSEKIIVHGCGQSRRLPAYAPLGKIFTPIPAFRWKKGQRIDQTLLDLQIPFFEAIFQQSNGNYRTLIASGDVLNWFNISSLKTLPEADVLCFGIWVEAKQASHHGVFFCPKETPSQLKFVLQKPTPAEIHQQSKDNLFLIDIGIWLLSDKATRLLMKKCGWQAKEQSFKSNIPNDYDLYSDYGQALGQNPTKKDASINKLSVAIHPLTNGHFLHFGKNTDLLESSLKLQNLTLDQRQLHNIHIKPHPKIFTQNTQTDIEFKPENHSLWVENSYITKKWQLANNHIITGIPNNNWSIKLPAKVCLDMVPIRENEYCIRPYGIEDMFKGDISADDTLFLSSPFSHWLKKRNLCEKDIDISLPCDIQFAPIFPVFKEGELSADFIQWLITPSPKDNAKHGEIWKNGAKLSASEISNQANISRLYKQRQQLLETNLPVLAKNYERSIFYQLDLKDLAQKYASTSSKLPATLPQTANIMTQIHDQMFRAEVKRNRQDESWTNHETEAYNLLSSAIIENSSENSCFPQVSAQQDQIFWGRSPVRLDLAGGWSDTPPYCIINGGKVVNLAVNLNGQPPIHAYIKRSNSNHIILRSIDLGREIKISKYEELETYNQVGDAFSIPKAAICLAGFSPTYQHIQQYKSLKQQLDDFGGGFELTLLAAIPKGSGLGTSSILAATILKTLSEFCSLNWDNTQVSNKTLLLEQMLTTGGGWQDQLGGLYKGLKLLETGPGFQQSAVVKWLPDFMFTSLPYKQNMLLYYTGITRVAKNILSEIVTGMFLNSQTHLAILEKIHNHAETAYQAFQTGSWSEMTNVIQKSWELNQALDPGTNPPGIQKIIAAIDDFCAAYKLLGAGGGGYMLIFAKDDVCADKIQRTLRANPPHPNARFVDFSISQTGTEVTRS